MKKLVLGWGFLCLLVPALAGARARRGSFVDSPSNVKQAVFANVGVVHGLYSVGYEREASRDTSWTLSGRLRPWFGPGYSSLEAGLTGSYRWWIAHYLPGVPSHALHGIFLGPQIVLDTYSVSFDRYASASGFGIGGGCEAGYQYIFRPGLLANAGLAVGYLSGNANYAAGAPPVSFGGSYAEGILSVGYAF